MGDRTGISWTQTISADGAITPGATWNPVSGCTKLTAECKFCYVERDWHRMTHLPAYAGREFTDVACHPDRLEQPIRWQRSRRIFVCSTSDLFHADVPDDFLNSVFAVMALCPHHTFLVLTKRTDRMQKYLSAPGRREAIAQAAEEFPAKHPLDWVRADGGEVVERGGNPDENTAWLPRWPLPNVHAGVTAGTQDALNERIGHLINTPAAKRWLSMEPLLESVSLRWLPAYPENAPYVGQNPSGQTNHLDGLRRIDGVIVGGESGVKARPMHPEWARDLRDQCREAGVPFFFKQHGEWAAIDPLDWDGKTKRIMLRRDGMAYLPVGERLPEMILDCQSREWACMAKLGRKVTGELLDGCEHREVAS